MDSHDLYLAEARTLTAWRVAEEKRIKNDPRLSHRGREDDLKKLADKYQEKRDDLTHRFKAEKNEAVKSHQAQLNRSGQKQSFRDRVRTKALKDSSTYDFITSEVEGQFALLEGIEEMTSAIRENTFVRAISSLDRTGINERINAAVQNNDTTRLQWLRNYAESLGGNMDPLVGVIDAAFEGNRPPREKFIQKCIEKLNHHEACFMQGLELAEKSGEMQDWRGGDIDQALTREMKSLNSESEKSK